MKFKKRMSMKTVRKLVNMSVNILQREIVRILRDSDIQKTTMKYVLQQLEKRLGVNMAKYKIKNHVTRLVVHELRKMYPNGRHTKRSKEEAQDLHRNKVKCCVHLHTQETLKLEPPAPERVVTTYFHTDPSIMYNILHDQYLKID